MKKIVIILSVLFCVSAVAFAKPAKCLCPEEMNCVCAPEKGGCMCADKMKCMCPKEMNCACAEKDGMKCGCMKQMKGKKTGQIPGYEKKIVKFMPELGLSEEQNKNLENLNEGQTVKQKDLGDKIVSIKKEEKGFIAGKDYESAKAKTRERYALEADASVNNIDYIKAVSEILTEEQNTKLGELMAKERQEKKEKMQNKDGGKKDGKKKEKSDGPKEKKEKVKKSK